MNETQPSPGKITQPITWLAFSLLLLLWVAGMSVGETMGGLLHILLFSALAVLLGRTYSQRNIA